MSEGLQTALRVLITITVFSLIMGIAFSIVGGKDVELVNKIVNILTANFVGN